MTRAPFQILVIPYYIDEGNIISYAVFKRSDGECWQFIAGGGEDDETPLEAAKREAYEEAGLEHELELNPLLYNEMLPVEEVSGNIWGDEVKFIPNHCFSVKVSVRRLKLSKEHTEYKWLKYEEAIALLKWEGNKKALAELNTYLILNQG